MHVIIHFMGGCYLLQGPCFSSRDLSGSKVTYGVDAASEHSHQINTHNTCAIFLEDCSVKFTILEALAAVVMGFVAPKA
jgi:hypothetical protein